MKSVVPKFARQGHSTLSGLTATPSLSQAKRKADTETGKPAKRARTDSQANSTNNTPEHPRPSPLTDHLGKRAKIFAQWTWMTIKGMAQVALEEEEVFGMPVVTKKGANLDLAKMTAYYQQMLDFGLKKCLGITGYTIEPAPTFTEVDYQPKHVIPFMNSSSSDISPLSLASASSSPPLIGHSNSAPRQLPTSASGDRLCRPDVVQEPTGGYAVNLTTGGKVSVSGPSKNQLKKAAREQKKQQVAAAASSARVVEPSSTAHPQRKSISDIDIAALRSGRPLPGSASGHPPTPSGLPGAATLQPTDQPTQSFSAPLTQFFGSSAAAPDNNHVSEHTSTTAARDVGHSKYAEHRSLHDLTGADVAGLPVVVEEEGLGGSLVGETGVEPATTTLGMATEERDAGGFDGHRSSPAAEEAEEAFNIEDWVNMDMFNGDSHFSPPSATGRSSVGQSSSAPGYDGEELMPLEDVMKLMQAIRED